MIDAVGMRVAVMNFRDDIEWLALVAQMNDDDILALYLKTLNAPSEY